MISGELRNEGSYHDHMRYRIVFKDEQLCPYCERRAERRLYRHAQWLQPRQEFKYEDEWIVLTRGGQVEDPMGNPFNPTEDYLLGISSENKPREDQNLSWTVGEEGGPVAEASSSSDLWHSSSVVNTDTEVEDANRETDNRNVEKEEPDTGAWKGKLPESEPSDRETHP
jgi:hypothetical protein